MKVLYVEDDARDADLTRRELARTAPQVDLEVVATLGEARARLAEGAAFDVMLTDLNLPDGNGLELVAETRERGLPLAVVALTGSDAEGIAVAAFKAGADDYLVKRSDYLPRLAAVLETAHGRARRARAEAGPHGGVTVAHENITERKLVAESLRASEERYGDLVSAVPGAVYTFRVDAEGRRSMPFMSAGIGDLVGLSADAVMTDVDVAFRQIPAEAMPAMEQSILASLKELSLWLHEFPIRTASGEEKWLRGQSLPRREADGATVWHGVFVDVTERRRAEHALQLSEANLRAMADNASVGILVNFRERHVFANRHMAQMLGYTAEELISTGIGDIIHPDARPEVAEHFRRRMAGESVPQQYESVALRKDGRGVPVEIRGALTRWNGQPAGMVFMSDITGRKRAEARFRDLFEISPDGVIMVDQQGLITLANRKTESLFGYTCDELIGLSVDKLIPQTDKASHAAARQQYFANPMPRSMGSRNAALRARRKDGTTFPTDISLSPMQSDEGTLVVATVRDVSARAQAEEQRRALEAQLFQAQKMEAIGTLAGGIAHDFNNIVSAIIGNVELAREDVGADHPAMQSLDEIRKASRRARDLVSQILAFSRQQPQPRHAVRLSPVVEEVVKLLRAGLPAGVVLGTTLAADTPNVLADPTQIHQILMNLCTNAWHAMDDGRGRIDIQLDTIVLGEDASRIHADLPPGRYARLSVRDSGKGMDAITRERIFEPFFTTKAVGEGTGLGLSVVHGIMRGYQGAITADSQPGGGTTFHLYFPEAEAAAETAGAEKAHAPSPQGRGQHVLYLDDDESLVLLVTRTLARNGYRVAGYTDSADALQALRADPDRFDLVVTDFNMPGMSGLDLAREVSRIRPDLPVVVTSGYITDELREQAPGAGVRQLVYKPDSAEELCETVRRLLDQGN